MKHVIDTEETTINTADVEAALVALRGRVELLPMTSRELALTLTKLDESIMWLRATYAAYWAQQERARHG